MPTWMAVGVRMISVPNFDFISHRETVVAAIYFYCDESGKYRKNPVVAISGIGANSERLARFNGEWVTLLRSYGLHEFHMSRIAQLSQSCGSKMPAGQSIEQRTQALLPFVDCINQCLEIGLLQGWDVKGYNGLSIEVKSQLGGSHDPYQLAFIRGILEIGNHLHEEDHLSIICDDDQLTAWNTYCHYRAISKSEPELEKKLAGIMFAKSQCFTLLQAADMVAFLARKEAH